MINIIYGLKDPRNDVYQYIGKSSVGSKRALTHLTKSHSEIVNEWISSLNENWLYPIVEIIEEVDDINQLSEREEYWIEYYYSINPMLLNKKLISKNLNNIRSEEEENDFNCLVRLCYNIHTILKNERLYRNITQEEMSKKLGINRSTLSLLESGHNVGFDIIQKYIITLKGIDILTKEKNQRTKKRVSVPSGKGGGL